MLKDKPPEQDKTQPPAAAPSPWAAAADRGHLQVCWRSHSAAITEQWSHCGSHPTQNSDHLVAALPVQTEGCWCHIDVVPAGLQTAEHCLMAGTRQGLWTGLEIHVSVQAAVLATLCPGSKLPDTATASSSSGAATADMPASWRHGQAAAQEDQQQPGSGLRESVAAVLQQPQRSIRCAHTLLSCTSQQNRARR